MKETSNKIMVMRKDKIILIIESVSSQNAMRKAAIRQCCFAMKAEKIF